MTDPLTTQLPEQACPRCGHKLSAASSLTEQLRPGPGDYSVCIACAGILQFGPRLHLIIPDPARVARERREDPELDLSLKQQVWAIEQMHRELGRP
jgi:hypothetical protein